MAPMSVRARLLQNEDKRRRRETAERLRVARATQEIRLVAFGLQHAAETAAIPLSLAEVMSWDA